MKLIFWLLCALASANIHGFSIHKEFSSFEEYRSVLAYILNETKSIDDQIYSEIENLLGQSEEPDEYLQNVGEFLLKSVYNDPTVPILDEFSMDFELSCQQIKEELQILFEVSRHFLMKAIRNEETMKMLKTLVTDLSKLGLENFDFVAKIIDTISENYAAQNHIFMMIENLDVEIQEEMELIAKYCKKDVPEEKGFLSALVKEFTGEDRDVGDEDYVGDYLMDLESFDGENAADKDMREFSDMQKLILNNLGNLDVTADIEEPVIDEPNNLENEEEFVPEDPAMLNLVGVLVNPLIVDTLNQVDVDEEKEAQPENIQDYNVNVKNLVAEIPYPYVYLNNKDKNLVKGTDNKGEIVDMLDLIDPREEDPQDPAIIEPVKTFYNPEIGINVQTPLEMGGTEKEIKEIEDLDLQEKQEKLTENKEEIIGFTDEWSEDRNLGRNDIQINEEMVVDGMDEDLAENDLTTIEENSKVADTKFLKDFDLYDFWVNLQEFLTNFLNLNQTNSNAQESLVQEEPETPFEGNSDEIILDPEIVAELEENPPEHNKIAEILELQKLMAEENSDLSGNDKLEYPKEIYNTGISNVQNENLVEILEHANPLVENTDLEEPKYSEGRENLLMVQNMTDAEIPEILENDDEARDFSDDFKKFEENFTESEDIPIDFQEENAEEPNILTKSDDLINVNDENQINQEDVIFLPENADVNDSTVQKELKELKSLEEQMELKNEKIREKIQELKDLSNEAENEETFPVDNNLNDENFEAHEDAESAMEDSEFSEDESNFIKKLNEMEEENMIEEAPETPDVEVESITEDDEVEIPEENDMSLDENQEIEANEPEVIEERESEDKRDSDEFEFDQDVNDEMSVLINENINEGIQEPQDETNEDIENFLNEDAANDQFEGEDLSDELLNDIENQENVENVEDRIGNEEGIEIPELELDDEIQSEKQEKLKQEIEELEKKLDETRDEQIVELKDLMEGEKSNMEQPAKNEEEGLLEKIEAVFQ